MEPYGMAHHRTLKEQSPQATQTATGGDLKNGPVQTWYEGQEFRGEYCINTCKNLIPPGPRTLSLGVFKSVLPSSVLVCSVAPDSSSLADLANI
jgi:hypothetical protein